MKQKFHTVSYLSSTEFRFDRDTGTHKCRWDRYIHKGGVRVYWAIFFPPIHEHTCVYRRPTGTPPREDIRVHHGRRPAGEGYRGGAIRPVPYHRSRGGGEDAFCETDSH